LIAGYQGEGTLGRTILEGKKEVRIDGIPVVVRASVNQTQAMSSHADQPKLLEWLKKIQGVKKLILTHGENGPRAALAEKIKTDLKIADIAMPILNQEITI
jgi:metallo-beta-lactamase family protein